MEYIKIGVITNTHGLKGTLKIKPYTDFSDLRFKKGNHIYIQMKQDMKEVVIANVKVLSNKKASDMIQLDFVDYNDINLVEAWKGFELFIRKEQLHSLEEDEVYYFELRDCKVYDTNDEYLGIISEFIETGANLVIRVKKDQQKDVLLPYVKEFIKEVDVKNKRIVVNLIEGML